MAAAAAGGLLTTAATLSPAAPARAAAATLRLNATGTGPNNLLPVFAFQFNGVEEALGISVAKQMPLKGGPENIDLSAPEDIWDGLMEHSRDWYLPYLVKDQYTDKRVPQDVPVIALENDAVRVSITPQWGGKLWSARDKRTGRDMFFSNPWHQPCNNGVLKAYTGGGCEFNWSPGMIGHTVFTEAPVFAARVPSPRGDIVRLWEFDRYNGTAWQVDVFLDERGTLWIHPRVHNPNHHPVRGYWWTNVGMATTTPQGVCRPKKGSANAEKGSRVISPASYTITNSVGGGAGKAPWPHYTASRSALGNPGRLGGRDVSFLANHDTYMDNFLRILRDPDRADGGAGPYLAWADDSLFGEQRGVVHGHNLNASKFWSQGQDETSLWTQRYHWGGCFTELQTGVSPTQLQSFPLDANSSREWTEWFRFMDGVGDVSALYADEYGTAVGAVDAWVKGQDGVPASDWRSTSDFLKEHSGVAVEASNVLHNGSGWGALHERLTGARVASGIAFTVDDGDEETAAWRELLDTGAFSAATLDRIPVSWAVDDTWLRRVDESAAAGGATWLHHLILATAAVEEGDLARAAALFNASAAASPAGGAGLPHALRGLASLRDDEAGKVAYYMRAWDAVGSLVQRGAPHARELQRHLAAETAQVLEYYADGGAGGGACGGSGAGAADALAQFVRAIDARLTADEAAHDLIVRARVKDLLLRGEDDAAIGILRTHFFVASGCPGLNRASLLVSGLWDRAQLQRRGRQLGRALSPLERRETILANPPPHSLGARYRLPEVPGVLPLK